MQGARRTGRIVAAIAAAVVVVTAGVAAAFVVPQLTTGRPAPTTTDAAAPATPTPTPVKPLTAAQQLLAASTDPAACAVTFTGDGVTDAPVLETQGALYAHLPIPTRAGAVFAGWYSTAADAAAYTPAARVNGAKAVACTGREITLHGSWKTPEQNAAEKVRVPILMYHQFTTNPNGENNSLRGNYAYVGDFQAHMDHIATTGFYLPTWPELSAFIDGRLSLPARSVIVTDDDADHTWLELAAPVVAKDKVLTTSFVITVWRSQPSPNMYVLQRSHTHDMHHAGANGKGLMVNLPADQVAADLEKSAAILGAKEVIAYPFGHYDDTAKQGVRQAGFDMARGIEPGYVTIGTDKLALPVQRIDYGMGLDALVRAIG